MNCIYSKLKYLNAIKKTHKFYRAQKIFVFYYMQPKFDLIMHTMYNKYHKYFMGYCYISLSYIIIRNISYSKMDNGLFLYMNTCYSNLYIFLDIILSKYLFDHFIRTNCVLYLPNIIIGL